MVVETDGVGVNGLFVGGVAEEEAVWDLFFLGSASRLLMKLLDRSSHSYTILFSFQ